LAKDNSNLIPVELVDFRLYADKGQTRKDEKVTDFLSPETEFRTEAWADCNVADLVQDDIIQFDRIGFFRVDRAFSNNQPAILFYIPTGKK